MNYLKLLFNSLKNTKIKELIERKINLNFFINFDSKIRKILKHTN